MNGIIKTTWLLVGLTIAVVASPSEGQVTLPTQILPTVQTPPWLQLPVVTQGPPGGASDYAISQVGPDSQTWTNSSGQSVTSLATGMNFWDGEQWNPSDASFTVSPDGTSFSATKLQDPTQLAANIASQGSVSVVTPDGVTLSSTPVAIGLYDAASGLSVIVASITNSTGVLVDPQHVVYSHAFVGGGFDAGIVYSLPDTGSFHQDVVFTGFNPNFDPTVWGFAANSTNTLQLQIFTEFYDPPQPQIRERAVYIEQDPNVRATMASPDFIDNFLDFGHYVFSPGKAYPSATYDFLTPGAAVAKDFVTSNGRTFLVESVRYRDIVGQLQGLPPVRTASLKQWPGARKMRLAALSVPKLRPNKSLAPDKIDSAKATAMVGRIPRGVSIDYIVTVSSLNEPTLYASDTTYFVTNNVYLTAPARIDSAVFKYGTNNSSGAIVIYDTLTMATTNYRPAIFTAADDNTAGATLSTSIWSGYTGNPSTNYYGLSALYFGTTSNILVNNIRINYLYTGLAANVDSAGWTISLSHSQMVGVSQGTDFTGTGGTPSVTFNANNCLFSHVRCPFIGAALGYTGNAYDCTVDSTASMTYMVSGAAGSFNFTNSIFSSVGYGTYGSVALGGGNNGFYNCGSTIGSPALSSTSYPYQSFTAGYYYLANTTPFLTNGTTNIPASLLGQLQMKTTQPPTLINNSIFTTDTTLSPVAQRDTTGLALGFHYDPIDYLGACAVTNATLTLINGVVVAYYDDCLTWLQDGSRLVSQGTPNNRNYIVYYTAVQEEPVYFWSGGILAQVRPFVPSPAGTSANPSVDLRLTTICAPTGETNLWQTGDYGAGTQVIGGLTLQDCEVYGSGATWLMNENANTPNVGFTNNVFYRVPFSINSNAKITSYNNLYYGTTNTGLFTTAISILHRSGGASPNITQNNVFDGTWSHIDGLVGYNAYIHGATNIYFTNNNDFFTNITWKGGPLGAYYQPTNSPLINAGSTSAKNLGLYDYTVTTNLISGVEIKETNSTVDLGYHYVALTSAGTPISTNGSGVPDYLAGFTMGIANAWLMEYFGTLDVNSNADYDGTGYSVLYDYQNGIDPNIISFSLGLTNQFVNNPSVSLAFTITAGMPCYMATLIDDTNTADAHWIAYAGSGATTVYLGTNQGWHQILLGFRGLPATGQQTWASRRVKLDLIPPVLVITNPSPGVVTAPVIQLQGYSPESLAIVSYNISNSTGLFTNQAGYVTALHFDTNSFENTTNNFACFNISLANGTNIITLSGTDLAGNKTTTNLIYNLNPSANTNPPMLSLTWPQNNTYITGTNFTLRGMVNDPFASVTAEIIDGGLTNSATGEVEQNGSLWIENLPLGSGTNYLTITATNSAGYGMATNIALIKSGVTLTIGSPSLYEGYASVSGTVSAGNYAVYVNGIQATNNGNGTWTAAAVPYNNSGTTTFSAQAEANGVFSATNAQHEIDMDNSMGVVDTSWEYALSVDGLISDGWTETYTEVSDWQLWQSGSQNNTDCYVSTNGVVSYGQESATWDSLGFGTANGGGGTHACGTVDSSDPPEPTTSWEEPPYAGGILQFDDQGGQGSPNYSFKSQWKVMLFTGGKAVGPQQNLWVINAPVFADETSFGGSGTVQSQLPSGPVTVAGQTEDASGNVYLTLPNNTSVDVTPHAQSTAYTAGGGPTATEYVPQIQANGVTLSSTSVNATFCVGQQVTLSLSYSPSLPFTPSNAIYNWTIPSSSVNSWTSNSTTGCLTYTNDPSLTKGTSSSTTCWCFSGSTGNVSVVASFYNSNGKLIRVSANGEFGIFTPSLVQFQQPLGNPEAILYTNSGNVRLGVGNAVIGTQATDYQLYVSNVFCSGKAGITQVFDDESFPIADGYSNLDGQIWYPNPNANLTTISTNFTSANRIGLFDAPYEGCNSSDGDVSILKIQFRDYARFRPDAGVAASNIFVTLGKITWTVNAEADYSSGIWTLNPTSTVTGPTLAAPNAEWPVWTNVVTPP